MHHSKLAFLLAATLTLLAVRPAIAQIQRAKEELRSVANLARLAIGDPACAPVKPDGTGIDQTCRALLR